MSTPAIDLARDRGGHLSDAELIRELDGEPALDTSSDPEAHLRACPLCAARQRRLTERRGRLAILLATSDAAAPAAATVEALFAEAGARRRRGQRRMALRAASVLLVAGALAAQPSVRRWAKRQLARASSNAVPVPSVPATDTARPDGGALSFEPGAGPFAIRFDVHPAAGTLTIIGDSGTRASVERVGGAEQELVVMPHGLRVRSRRADQASYVVRVPSMVQRVTVRFGDAAVEIGIDVGAGTSQVIHFARVDR